MGFSKPELQQIAMSLKAAKPGHDVALAHLNTGNTVYYAYHDATRRSYPTSAIVELIQGLNQHDTPGYTDRVLRDGKRVFSTFEANTMDTEMARMNDITLEKLSAKGLPEEYERPARGTYVQVESDRWTARSPLLSFADVTGGPAPAVVFGGGKAAGAHTLDRLYMMAVFSLVASRFIRKYQGLADANIGALLVSSVGQILAWSVNTKEHNSTCHAEVNLLQGCFRNAPATVMDGARLYTTLKPCQMCAGMIQHTGGGRIDVIYGQGDPGEDAQETVLDGTGKLHALDGSKPGMKGVMAVLKTGPGTEKANLLTRLEEEREATKAQGAIAHTLSLKGSKLLMRGAVRAMGAKLAKYRDPLAGNDNVRRALAHIEPFLTRHGAHPTQISAVSDYLYADADAVGYD
jgi:tRNA(Arg) A34 adenosine deaminase TadA